MTLRANKKRKLPVGFGERLNHAIMLSGLSLSEIERRSGVSHGNISHYCAEVMLPSAYNLYELSRVLHVSSDWLLGLSDVMERRII